MAAWEGREQEYKAARERIEVQFAALFAEVKRVETQWLQKVDQQHEIIVSKEEAAREVATRLTTFTFSAAGLEAQRSFEDKLKYCENAKKAAATLQSLRIPSPPSASIPACEWTPRNMAVFKTLISNAGTLSFGVQ